MFPRLLTPILVLCAFSTGLANWIERSPGGDVLSWNGITSSSDGIKLAAVVNPGNIWISSDSGGNWTERSPGGGTKSWASRGEVDNDQLQHAHIASLTVGGFIKKIAGRGRTDGHARAV